MSARSTAEQGLTIWASGLDHRSTGVGVIQRRVLQALQEVDGHQVVMGPDRPTEPTRTRTVIYKLRQLMASTAGADVAVVMTSPRPIRLSQPYVSVVYDVRWLRTSGWLKRLYRRLELHWTTTSANRVLVISRRSQSELLTVVPSLRDRTEVLPLGPGQCSASDFEEGEDGTVLLVGAAPHKRNAEMIEALSLARPSWCRQLMCVNLRDGDVELALRTLGPDRVERYRDLPPERMAALFRRASVYACLSIEEGFGLPFIEALASGARVLAIDQPLTRELLGDAGVLISDGSVQEIAEQLNGVTWPEPAVRRRRAAAFSWEATAQVVRRAIDEVRAG